MLRTLGLQTRKKCSFTARVAVVAILAASGGGVLYAQNRNDAQVPNGLALSEFRGYEDWRVVAVSQTEQNLKVIVANPTMIEAYRSGVHANGQPFPDGSKAAKIEWTAMRSTVSPFPVRVPEALDGIGFMVRDSQRFADSAGWGYAQFKYDGTTETLVPDSRYSGTNCGAACHTIAQARNYVFTAYPRR